jgi:hypothetical protein
MGRVQTEHDAVLTRHPAATTAKTKTRLPTQTISLHPPGLIDKWKVPPSNFSACSHFRADLLRQMGQFESFIACF